MPPRLNRPLPCTILALRLADFSDTAICSNLQYSLRPGDCTQLLVLTAVAAVEVLSCGVQGAASAWSPTAMRVATKRVRQHRARVQLHHCLRISPWSCHPVVCLAAAAAFCTVGIVSSSLSGCCTAALHSGSPSEIYPRSRWLPSQAKAEYVTATQCPLKRAAVPRAASTGQQPVCCEWIEAECRTRPPDE